MIQIDELVFSYRGRCVYDGMSLELKDGARIRAPWKERSRQDYPYETYRRAPKMRKRTD